MPHLKIHTTDALIGINQTWPHLDTHTHIPHLPRRTRYPRVILRRVEPHLTIDQTHVRAELGIENGPTLMATPPKKGRRQPPQDKNGPARGPQARFYSGENAIAAIARESSYTRAELNIVCWPTRPDIKVYTGGLDIDLQPLAAPAVTTPFGPRKETSPGQLSRFTCAKNRILK